MSTVTSAGSTATIAGTTTSRDQRPPQPRPLAGLGHQVRFMIRRDRIRAPIWWAAIVGLVTVSAASVVGLYHTASELANYAQVAQADAALKAITGPGFGLDNPTQGAVVMNEVSMFTFVGVALMCIFMMIRHTRAEEATDRAELVRSTPVGRYASLLAAVIWVSAATVAVGVGLVLGMLANGLPRGGSVAFGAAATGIGLVFVGVAAVTAQVASSARAATAIAGTTLAVFFVLRAVGDMGNGWVSWISPLGWAQAIRAFADERWWVLAPLGGTAVLLVTAGVVLSSRRDLGAGILPQRPGPPEAGPRLSTPLALAFRLQRTSLIGWAIGIGLTGFFFGIVADQADALTENQAVADILAQAGQGSVTDSFLATIVLLSALVASGFVVSSVLRLRSEESAVHAEPMLATPVSRQSWLWSHLTVAAAGSIVIMVIAGAMTGFGYAIQVGDAGKIPSVIGAAVAMVPALWVLAGLTVAFVGLKPRWAPVAWAAVAISAVVGLLGETLGLPQWTRDLSPFQHVPAMPAAAFDLLPEVALAGVAVGLVLIGSVAIRHRDIG